MPAHAYRVPSYCDHAKQVKAGDAEQQEPYKIKKKTGGDE